MCPNCDSKPRLENFARRNLGGFCFEKLYEQLYTMARYSNIIQLFFAGEIGHFTLANP